MVVQKLMTLVIKKVENSGQCLNILIFKYLGKNINRILL